MHRRWNKLLVPIGHSAQVHLARLSFTIKSLKPNLSFITNPLLITFSQPRSQDVIIPCYVHEVQALDTKTRVTMGQKNETKIH